MDSSSSCPASLSSLFLTHSIDCICFDVDSTVINEEGIDLLSIQCNKYELVQSFTASAMNGEMKFEDSLRERLNIIRPSMIDIENCLKQTPPKLTENCQQLISLLHELKIPVYLISGGFIQLIEPIAKQLNINPQTNIYANKLYFDENGQYSGYDLNSFTAYSGGKSKAIADIIRKNPLYKTIVMIGDGITDMEAKPPATAVIGYGGVVKRKKVAEIADWYIHNWEQIIHLLKQKSS